MNTNRPYWQPALEDVERVAARDFETMASGKKTLTAIKHLRYVLESTVCEGLDSGVKFDGNFKPIP